MLAATSVCCIALGLVCMMTLKKLRDSEKKRDYLRLALGSCASVNPPKGHHYVVDSNEMFLSGCTPGSKVDTSYGYKLISDTVYILCGNPGTFVISDTASGRLAVEEMARRMEHLFPVHDTIMLDNPRETRILKERIKSLEKQLWEAYKKHHGDFGFGYSDPDPGQGGMYIGGDWGRGLSGSDFSHGNDTALIGKNIRYIDSLLEKIRQMPKSYWQPKN